MRKNNIIISALAITVLFIIFTGSVLYTFYVKYKRGIMPDDNIEHNEYTENNDNAGHNKYNGHGKTEEGEKGLEDERDAIKEKIKEMTLAEKAGQMLIAGFNGKEVNGEIKTLIQDYGMSGFILYERNIEDPQQLLELINSLKGENARNNNIPIFISVDEEGGRVSRMPKEMKNTPPNGIIGQINKEEFSHSIGKIIGEKLKIFGFNMNYAPVLDINSNPENPVIGDRSLSSDEKVVSTQGRSILKGLKSQGIIPVIKHFPGHGDTYIDSHLGLPSIQHNLERLMDFELIPFRNAFVDGADVVMTAHILLTEIDSDKPASLSGKIVTGILREQLGFDGVVITDDITMGAITKNYGLAEGALGALLAGSDMILVSHEYDNVVEVFNALKEAMEKGVLPQEKVDESLYRILKLKKQYMLDDTEKSIPSLYDSIENINKDIERLLENNGQIIE